MAVEKRNFFLRLCHADLNRASQAFVVERMHGLAEFEHDVVGDINQGVYAANAGPPQSLTQPVRTFLILFKPPNNAADITRTSDWRRQFDFSLFFISSFDRRRRGAEKRSAGHGRGLSCDAEHAEAVAPVRCEFHLKNLVGQPKRMICTFAESGIFV